MANTITCSTLGRAFAGAVNSKSFVQSGANYRTDQNSRSILRTIINAICNLISGGVYSAITEIEIQDKSEKLKKNVLAVAIATLKLQRPGSEEIPICDESLSHDYDGVVMGAADKTFVIKCDGSNGVTIEHEGSFIRLQHTLPQLKKAMLEEYLAQMRKKPHDGRISLSGFDLSDLDLSALPVYDCDFSGALIEGTTFGGYLVGANFEGAHQTLAAFNSSRKEADPVLQGGIEDDAPLPIADAVTLVSNFHLRHISLDRVSIWARDSHPDARQITRTSAAHNLFDQVDVERSIPKVQNFVQLAKDLEKVHRDGYVHQGIIPSNMRFSGRDVRLVIGDSMRLSSAAQTKKNIKVNDYIHPDLRSGDDGGEEPVIPVDKRKVDQYSFIYSIFSALNNNENNKFDERILRNFVYHQLPCSAPLKIELLAFLLNPAENSLNNPLSAYLTAELSV